MAVFGYARVSTDTQDLTRQLKALVNAGVEPQNIFKDIGSGKDFTSIDRLGRDMKTVEQEYKVITELRQCKLISLDEPFLSLSDNEIMNELLRPILLKFLSWVAERERKEMLHRQKEAYNSMKKDWKGRLISNKTGKVMGRPKKYIDLTKAQRDIVEEWINGTRSCLSVARELGISRTTLYRIKEEEYQ